jgi:MFS family permease
LRRWARSIGLSYGAEVDMAGYLTARYFGMRAFGRCYGVLYTFVLIGAIAGPWSFAILYDVTKSYNVALFGGAGLFFTGSMLLLTLPRFSHTPLPTQQPAIR